MARPRKLRKNPLAYADAIEKRISKVEGVHRTSKMYLGRQRHVSLVVTYHAAPDGEDGPDPLLENRVDDLRREFSTAFPEWGISIEWRLHLPVRIRPVVDVQIVDGYLVYKLTCGHYVKGERIKVKRRCECCTEGAT